MACSMSGFTTLHQLLEFAQTHVHWVSDAIQPSHPLSSPSPPAFNLSQHQGLSQWVSSLPYMAKVLELQNQFIQQIFMKLQYSGYMMRRADSLEIFLSNFKFKSREYERVNIYHINFQPNFLVLHLQKKMKYWTETNNHFLPSSPFPELYK